MGARFFGAVFQKKGSRDQAVVTAPPSNLTRLLNNIPCEQRLHFRGMSWRTKSYFSHASSYRENVASARRI